MPTTWEEIELKIEAGYPFLYLLTHEEGRVAGRLQHLCKKLGRSFTVWSGYSGFDPAPGSPHTDPLETIEKQIDPGVYMMRDFHRRMIAPKIIRQMRDMRDKFIDKKQTLIITAPILDIPPELNKQFSVIDVPLPESNEMSAIFFEMCRQNELTVDKDTVELFGRSATGLTASEAMFIFSRMLLETDKILEGNTAPIIEEKRRLVESEGVLQFYERSVSLDDVGGLNSLKDWLKERKSAFSDKAREFGLPEPKGLLLLGVQGCGKSLSAKSIAAHWRLPLVQFDIGAAFSGAKSPEENIRQALKLLEAMSPVVLWIDEIEKAFAGTKGEGGEVAVQRIFGHFITWLQEKRKPVFVVATANNIDDLPPELLRKGRFDELFFVDLPDLHEREEIFKVHLASRKIDITDWKLSELIEETRNFSGSEIEQIVVDSMFKAFTDSRELEIDDLLNTAKDMIPIYNTYEEDIKALRDWAKKRTRKASTDTTLTDYFEKETN